MKNQYSKLYFEKYAALTLHQYLNIDERLIIQADRPDLRIPHLAMGIEVTQAIKDDVVFSLKKENLYGSYVMNPFDLKEILRLHPVAIQEYLKNIDFAIQRKIMKSKNYESYTLNGLYIFTHCNYLSKQSILTFFKKHSYKNTFYRFIYLNAIQNLFIYDCLKKEVEVYTYEIKDLIAYNQYSLLYEKQLYDSMKKQKDEDK